MPADDDDPLPDVEHRWLGYATGAPGPFVAVCTCGWQSPALPTAGLAGTAWDGHRSAADRPEDA